jgi:DNA repair protein RadC
MPAKLKRYWTSKADIMFVRRSVKYHPSCVAEGGGSEYRVEHMMGTPITCAQDAHNAAVELLGDLMCEGVVVMFLDAPNKLMGACLLSLGGVDQCVLSVRNLYASAILSGARSIIFAHNHPGGNLEPSEADWNVVKRLVQTGELLEIPLLDSLIVCGDKSEVVSMRSMPRWPRN